MNPKPEITFGTRIRKSPFFDSTIKWNGLLMPLRLIYVFPKLNLWQNLIFSQIKNPPAKL